MRVEVINVVVENKGKYRVADVSWKNQDGKVDGKKLMSFVNKDVFKTFSEAKQGDVFDVKPVKNDKGYWDWVEATSAGKSVGGSGQTKSEGFTAALRQGRDFETAEERAKKQVYIVRQSSVSSAIALAVANGQRPVTEADVITSAKKIEEYVLGIEPVVEAEVS